MAGVAVAVVLASAALSACGNPTQALTHCVGASDSTVQAIQQKVTTKAQLRNGKMVKLAGSPTTFISAEIHPDSDAPHDKGKIATWATTDVKSSDSFQSVDVHAREQSAWPKSSLNVRANGAIESRACTNGNRGKTPAQVRCEQQKSTGSGPAVPNNEDCSKL